MQKKCCGQVFTVRESFICGICMLLKHVTIPWSHCKLVSYFLFLIKSHFNIQLNCQIKYLKYIHIALIFCWCGIHLGIINFQLGSVYASEDGYKQHLEFTAYVLCTGTSTPIKNIPPQNIFVYKLILLLNISDFNLFFM